MCSDHVRVPSTDDSDDDKPMARYAGCSRATLVIIVSVVVIACVVLVICPSILTTGTGSMESIIKAPTMTMTFEITQQWDGRPSGHDPITVTLSTSQKSDDAITMEVSAPFFNDPGNPGGEPGEPFDKLWDYEVVEAFFLGENNKYLEVELCPHGQHIVLMLNGVRNVIKTKLALDFQATITDNTWKGSAEIPLDYLPPKTSLFNAYAIHGSDPNRRYEALYPAHPDAHPEPDFHRLEYFKPIDLELLISQPLKSKLWDDVA